MLKYLQTGIAVLAGVTAGLNTLPYGWAHVTVTALGAGIAAVMSAYAGGTIAVESYKKASTVTTMAKFWEGDAK